MKKWEAKNRLERCLFSPRRTWTSTGDQGRVLMKQVASGELLDLIQSFILFMENWFFNQSAWCGLTKSIRGGKRRKLQGLPPYHRLLTDLLGILLEMCLGSSVRVQLRHGLQLWKQGWQLHSPTHVHCLWHHGQHCHRNFCLRQWKLEEGKKAMAAEPWSFCFCICQ